MSNFYENNVKTTIKKYLPIAPLIILTILLMLVFRYNKGSINKLVEKGKQNLISFYTQNLEPIFAQSEISNEDVFNFALYKTLPIDKQNNKVLLLSDTKNSKQIFEIKHVPFNRDTKNYENFVEYLGMNKEEKEITDSILNSYKKEISYSILVNDKNTVAINPKLAEIQKAILADLLNYSLKVNPKRIEILFKHIELLSKKDLSKFIASTKKIPNNEYIFITPDTIFKKSITLDTNKLKLELKGNLKQPSIQKLKNINIEIVFDKDIKQVKEPKYYNFLEKPDSNTIKVEIPINQFSYLPKLDDSIIIKLQNLEGLLKRLSVNSERARSSIFKKNELSDETLIQFEDPTTFVHKAVEIFANQKIWEEVASQMDSLAELYGKSYSDSVVKRINNDKKLLSR